MPLSVQSIGSAMMASLLIAQGTGLAQRPEGAGAPLFSRAEVLLRDSGVVPGGSSELGLLIVLADGWHTYTDPPGDSGMPPMCDIAWPEGVTPGPVRFPEHRAFSDSAGTTFGFEGAVLLRIPFTVAESVAPGTTLSLKGQVDYLICRDRCVPQSARIDVRFRVLTKRRENEQWHTAARQGGWEGD